MTTLLPTEAITPELLNRVAKMFFDEDREGKMPAWWPALVAAAKEACERQVKEGMLEMVSSGMGFMEGGGGVNTATVSGLILKAMMVGWRLADLYLSEQLEKSAN